MQVQKVTKKWGITLIVVALAALALFGEHYSRCNGKPLSREEALQRANAQLQLLARDFELGDSLPVLTEEQYDTTHKSWILTFRNPTCEVSIIADRCHGTDIGGVSAGCKERRGNH
jgi:hypothetical protein